MVGAGQRPAQGERHDYFPSPDCPESPAGLASAPRPPVLEPPGMTDDPPPTPRCCPPGCATCCRRTPKPRPPRWRPSWRIFAAHGYQRVKPPLLEFEDSLLAGSGAAVADQTFRLMDPDSHRMMGLRADMTPQVARIAATRLAHLPRPLRLSYAGQCLRVRAASSPPTGRSPRPASN